jgi:hypothetical protein
VTLKLVAVEGEVIPDVLLGDELHAFAEDVEQGTHGDAIGVISLVVTDDGVKICWFGEDYSHYELMGLFEAAKLRVFADDAIPDE